MRNAVPAKNETIPQLPQEQIDKIKEEPTTYGEFSIGDKIKGSELSKHSGGNTTGESGAEYRLVQKPLDQYNYTREDIYADQGYEHKDEEDARIEKMKSEFDATPPKPPSDDGLHRIVAAKELGRKTILAW